MNAQGPKPFIDWRRNSGGMLDLTQFKVWTEEEFARAFPPRPAPPKSNGGGKAAQGGGRADDIAIDAADFPHRERDLICDGVAVGERSTAFYGLVKWLKDEGYTIDQVFECLNRYPNGIAQKYKGRLRSQVESVYGKVGLGAGPARPAAPTAAPRAQPAVSPPELFDPWRKFIVPAFPFDVLPPTVREFVLVRSRAMGVDASAMAVAALVTLSGAIHHRSRLVMTSTWEEHIRLWGLLVGPPSFKKTPLINVVVRPLVRRQADLMRQHRAAMRQHKANKAQGAQEPDPPERFVVGDTTIEKLGEMLSRSDRGALAKFDEIVGWIGRMERYHPGGAADRAFWLESWNGGEYSVDRVSSGETLISNLSLSILAGAQPARLAEIFKLTSDGLLQRFWPVVMQAPTLFEDIDCDDAVEDYEDLIHALIVQPPRRLNLSPDAVETMRNLIVHLLQLERACDSFSAGFAGFVGKLPAYAGVLTGILHLVDEQERGAGMARFGGAVARATVERVDRLVREFVLPHAYEFYGQGDGVSERLQRLASYVLTCGKDRLRLADLTNNSRECRGLSVAAINERLSPLVAGGWLVPLGSGPLCRVWSVNRAAIDLQFARRAEEEEERKAAMQTLLKR